MCTEDQHEWCLRQEFLIIGSCNQRGFMLVITDQVDFICLQVPRRGCPVHGLQNLLKLFRFNRLVFISSYGMSLIDDFKEIHYGRSSNYSLSLVLQRNVRQLEAPHTGKNGCGHYVWRQFASPNKGETATLRCNIRYCPKSNQDADTHIPRHSPCSPTLASRPSGSAASACEQIRQEC